MLDHNAAVAAWRDLRSKPLNGQSVDLVAAWDNRIFLRHRFSAEEYDMHFVPVDAPIEQFFFQGISGDTLIMRPSGRPKKGSGDEKDWSAVDWSKSNAEIARDLDVRPQVVGIQRKRHSVI